MQFTYQLQNTAPRMVQKQFVVNNKKKKKRKEKKINFLVSNVYIHASLSVIMN